MKFVRVLPIFLILLFLISFISANIVTPISPADLTCDGRTCNIANIGTLDGFDLDQDVTTTGSPTFDLITSADGGTESIKISGGIGKIESLASTLTLKSSAGLGIFLQSGDHVSIIVSAGKSLQPFTNGNIDLGRTTVRWRNLYLDGFISDGINNYSLPDLNKGTWPIQDANIDFGTGAGQVSALDVPIADNENYYNGSEIETALQEIGYWTKEGIRDPTGFPLKTSTPVTITFTDGTKTLSVSPSGNDFNFFVKGKLFTKTSEETLVATDDEGVHYFYYNSTGSLTENVTPTIQELEDIFRDTPQVAVIYWNTTDNEAIYFTGTNELHGTQMDGETHEYLHFTRGSIFLSGFAVGDITADNGGNADGDAQLSVANGRFEDEDIEMEITDGSPQTLSVPAEIPIFYKLDSSLWKKITATTFVISTTGTGRAAYNLNSAGTWSLEEVSNNQFTLSHIFATNNEAAPIIIVMGENEYATKTLAREGAVTELNDITTAGLGFQEFVPIATILFQTKDTYSNTVKSQIVSTDAGEDFVDWRFQELSPSVTPSSHSNLTGLGNQEDHQDYLTLDGSRPMEADINAGGNSIFNANDINATTGNFNNITVIGDSSPSIQITDTTNTVTTFIQSLDTSVAIGSLTNHAVGLYSNSMLAITIDTSQNVFTAANLNAIGTMQATQLTLTGASGFDLTVNGATKFDSASSHIQLANAGVAKAVIQTFSDIIFVRDWSTNTHGLSISLISGTGAISGNWQVNGGNLGTTADFDLIGLESELVTIRGSQLITGTSPTLKMDDPSVAHGMTAISETSTFGAFAIGTSTKGGFSFIGLSDSADTEGLKLQGVIGNANPDDDVAAVRVLGFKKNGTTVQVLGDDETIFAISNGGFPNALTIRGNNDVELAKDLNAVGTVTTDQLIGQGTAPTIVKGAAAGTSPTISLDGTDVGGTISISPDTDDGIGTLATITYDTAFPNASYVVLFPADEDSASVAIDIWVNATASTFTIETEANLVGVTHIWNYVVIGR